MCPQSLIDLVGLGRRADDFLAAVLNTAGQPIWVVDHRGVIRFANPAAIAALGYDDADELLGRDSHQTIHHRRLDGTPYPAAQCPMLLPRVTGETVRRDLDWFVRRDGTMFPVSYVSAPIELRDGRGAVVAFTDIEDRVHAERVLRDHDAVLASREAALLRIARLVADGAGSADVFGAVAREVAQVLSMALVVIWRYEPGSPAIVAGAWGDRQHPFRAGSAWPVDQHTLKTLLPEIGRPSRIEDFGVVGGGIATAIADAGVRSGAGAAIIVDGDVWGVMGGGVSESQSLPESIEARLAEFTDLVATTISNTESRQELARLADEQAALRRVAMLVAGGVPPSDVFAAVAQEVRAALGVDVVQISRYEADGTATPVICRASMGDDTANGAEASAPIVVDGRLWGVMVVYSEAGHPLAVDAAKSIGAFSEVVAMAISNAEAREEVAAARSEVAASRSRILAATDAERRRVVRDLHDGAQQRLVHTTITLKLARRALSAGEPCTGTLLTEALDHAEQATIELRELAHGILPNVLVRGGLNAGVDALVARVPVEVKTHVTVGRLPAAVEATAYFVVAEALTNVVKHSQARLAAVTARVEDDMLRVLVTDDGVGGARSDGSGLIGLADRLSAFDGWLDVESPPSGGTLLEAYIPIPR
jgi:PAS domain S-box-containing protein